MGGGLLGGAGTRAGRLEDEDEDGRAEYGRRVLAIGDLLGLLGLSVAGGGNVGGRGLDFGA